VSSPDTERARTAALGAAVILALACTSSSGEGGDGRAAPKTRPAVLAADRAPGSVAERRRGPGAASRSGWTSFRGSPQRTGRAARAGPRRAKVAWVFRTGGRIYADAAVAPDGTIYVASHDHHLYAVDPEGREIWSYDARGKIWTSPAIAKDGTVYVGSDEDRLAAVAPDGREKWIFSTTEPAAKGESPEAGRYDVDTSPAILANGSIVFGCHTRIFALRPSGSLDWTFEAGVGRAKVFSSPALGHDGSIYFGTQGRYFFALDGKGRVLWHERTGGDNDSTPAVGDDGTVYFASDDGELRAAAPGGALRWETDLGAPIRAPISVGWDGTVFASTYGREPFIAAFDPETGVERWRFATGRGDGDFWGIQSGALVDPEGYVYFGSRDHHVYCLSPRGELAWRHETGDQVDSGPVMGPDGTVYVGSDDGRLYAFVR